MLTRQKLLQLMIIFTLLFSGMLIVAQNHASANSIAPYAKPSIYASSTD